MSLLPHLGQTLKVFIVSCLVVSIILATVVVKNIHQPITVFEKVEELDENLVSWESAGFYVKVQEHNVFGVHLRAQGDVLQNKTCIILHGFPSSSFEYSYGAAEGLQSLGYDVLMHDHVGFGFSDKPLTGFGYSIHDHADVALAFYESLWPDIRGPIVFISHDMGDSILTEILTRYGRKPNVFPSSIELRRAIFTNGGMYMKEASLRTSQRLLSSSIAEQFCHLVNNLDPTGVIARHQLKSVFSSSIRAAPSESAVGKQAAHQIQLIQDLLHFKGGHVILWRLSRYLQDRYACEERWMYGLKHLEASVVLRFVWGADDSVAPLAIPRAFIDKANLTVSTLRVVEGKGHFWMLEEGDGGFWASVMHQTIEGP